MPGLGAPVRNGREVRTTLSAPAPRNAWGGAAVSSAWRGGLRAATSAEAGHCDSLGVHGLKGNDAAKLEPRRRMVSRNARPVESRDEPGSARSLLSAVPVVRARRWAVRHGRRRAMEGGPGEVNRTACFDGRWLSGSEAGDETAPRMCRRG